MSVPLCAARVSACLCTLLTVTEGHGGEKLALLLRIQEFLIHISVQRQNVLAERCMTFVKSLQADFRSVSRTRSQPLVACYLIIIIIIIIIITAIGLSPGGSGYFTCIQNMKLVTNKFI